MRPLNAQTTTAALSAQNSTTTLNAGLSTTQVLGQAADVTLSTGITQDQVGLSASTTQGVGAGNRGESVYNANNVLNPNTQSPITDYKTARELEQGSREDFVRTWGGWSEEQLWDVHSHLSKRFNSEVNTLLGILPELEARGLRRYMPELHRAGRHTTTTLEAQIPDRAYGHRVIKTNSTYQFNVEHFRVIGNAEAFLHVPVQNFNFQQALHIGKYMHFATDTIQQSHIHSFRRAEDSLTDMGHSVTRYNNQTLYETSANSKLVAGDQQLYADYQWHQVGQWYPNNRFRPEREPEPPINRNIRLLHPYRTALSGKWGWEFNLISDELETVTYLNNIDFEAHNAFNVRTNWAPITFFAARYCQWRFMRPARPPQGPCLGDFRVGARDNILQMTYEGDIRHYAGINSRTDYLVGASRDIAHHAKANYHASAEGDVHVWSKGAVYIDGPEVYINCGKAQPKLVSPFRVFVPLKAYRHRVYRQMTDVAPYKKQTLMAPTPKPQIEPRTPDATMVKNGPEHLGLYEQIGATPTRSLRYVGRTRSPGGTSPPRPGGATPSSTPPQPAPGATPPRPGGVTPPRPGGATPPRPGGATPPTPAPAPWDLQEDVLAVVYDFTVWEDDTPAPEWVWEWTFDALELRFGDFLGVWVVFDDR